MGFKINMNWINREFEWIWGALRVVVNMINLWNSQRFNKILFKKKHLG